MHGPSLPFQGRWLGAAETERSYQICSNLSVSLRLPAPLKGEPLGCTLLGRGSAPPVVPMRSAPAGGAEPRPYKVCARQGQWSRRRFAHRGAFPLRRLFFFGKLC